MTTFVSEARIVQTVLDPRTGSKHVIDLQYERERRTPKPAPSPRGYAQQAAIFTTLTESGYDPSLASIVAREFVDIP